MKLYKNINTALKDRENARHLKLTLSDDNIDQKLTGLSELEELILITKGDIVLPEFIEELKSLKVFSIQCPGKVALAQSIFKLPNLKHLKVKAKKVVLNIPPAPSTSLETLMLSDCALGEIPYSLFEISSLKTINLAGNGIIEIPMAIKELQSLQRLVLDRNLLTNLPQALEEITSLSHLSLDGNKFSDAEKERIKKTFNIWFS